MKTKLMALFLALLMCAALAACGQPAEKDDPAPAPSQSQTPAEDPSGGETKNLASFKVGFAQDTLNQPWRSNQADCVVSEFAKYGDRKSVV